MKLSYGIGLSIDTCDLTAIERRIVELNTTFLRATHNSNSRREAAEAASEYHVEEYQIYTQFGALEEISTMEYISD